MKKTTTILKTLFILLLTNYSIAQYSNASLTGPWWTTTDADTYILFDGNGNINEFGIFSGVTGSNIGTYSVASNGDITGTFDVFMMSFTGSFTDANNATLTIAGQGSFPIERILYPGALAETLTGSFVVDSETKNVVLTVDANGAITASTGDLNVTGGHIYTHNGEVAGFCVTDDPNCWEKFLINGAYASNVISGTCSVDCNTLPIGTTNLTRSGTAIFADINELQNDIISIYPNPSNDNVVITNSNGSIASIVDITGKVIQTIDMSGLNQIQLDLKSFESGIYFINVDETSSYRFVKN